MLKRKEKKTGFAKLQDVESLRENLLITEDWRGSPRGGQAEVGVGCWRSSHIKTPNCPGLLTM
jgi:hypothetical protein